MLSVSTCLLKKLNDDDDDDQSLYSVNAVLLYESFVGTDDPSL